VEKIVKLALKRADFEKIKQHAVRSYPKECCGLLMGRRDREILETKEVIQAENVLNSPIAFEADAELVLKAFDKAGKAGLDLIGIYHSHPNIHACVSGRDAEIMKLWPRVAWLIVSVSKERVVGRKAYMLKGGKIEKLEIAAT
jgi:proteasome lid subunit RPN8/RPN11